MKLPARLPCRGLRRKGTPGRRGVYSTAAHASFVSKKKPFHFCLSVSRRSAIAPSFSVVAPVDSRQDEWLTPAEAARLSASHRRTRKRRGQGQT